MRPDGNYLFIKVLDSPLKHPSYSKHHEEMEGTTLAFPVDQSSQMK